VEIGEYGWSLGNWRLVALLGILEVEKGGELLRPQVTLVPLSKVHEQAIHRLEHADGSPSSE